MERLRRERKRESVAGEDRLERGKNEASKEERKRKERKKERKKGRKEGRERRGFSSGVCSSHCSQGHKAEKPWHDVATRSRSVKGDAV